MRAGKFLPGLFMRTYSVGHDFASVRPIDEAQGSQQSREIPPHDDNPSGIHPADFTQPHTHTPPLPPLTVGPVIPIGRYIQNIAHSKRYEGGITMRTWRQGRVWITTAATGLLAITGAHAEPPE